MKYVKDQFVTIGAATPEHSALEEKPIRFQRPKATPDAGGYILNKP